MPAASQSDEDDVSSSNENDERAKADNLDIDTTGLRQRTFTSGSAISINTGGG